MEEIILKSKSEPQKLMFIFHGYGAAEKDLLPIGEEFTKAIPSAEIHLPRGLEMCDGGMGYRWFSLDGEDVRIWKDAFTENSQKIVSYIESVMKEKHLDYKDVILAGFSQGAMISLNLGLEHKVCAIISFSGVLFDLRQDISRSSTKVLLTHGVQDNVIDVSAVRFAENALKNLGIYVKVVISANSGHSIDNYMLTRAVDFLKSL